MPAYNIERLKEAAGKVAIHAEKEFKKGDDDVDVEITCTYDMPFRTQVFAMLLGVVYHKTCTMHMYICRYSGVVLEDGSVNFTTKP